MKALDALAVGARGDENLLELSIEAVRLRATVGEVSQALENHFTRYRVSAQSISGIYSTAYADDESFKKIRTDVSDFLDQEGRRPRLLVVKLGQDGHDRGSKVIATAFADIGFDVDIGALFQTPYEAAREAVENDVHVVGVSSLAAGHKTLVPELLSELRSQGAEKTLVVCGGVIPPNDEKFLLSAGVSAVYGPGTNIPKAAAEIMSLIVRQ